MALVTMLDLSVLFTPNRFPYFFFKRRLIVSNVIDLSRSFDGNSSDCF